MGNGRSYRTALPARGRRYRYAKNEEDARVALLSILKLDSGPPRQFLHALYWSQFRVHLDSQQGSMALPMPLLRFDHFDANCQGQCLQIRGKYPTPEALIPSKCVAVQH